MGSLRLPVCSGQEPLHATPCGCKHRAILQGGAKALGVESRKLVMTGLGEGDSCNFKEMLKN